MGRYSSAIFLSAFLLFQVQPLIAKRILPWFGGVPSVWTVCMLFFQALLLAGYAYAHLLTSKLPPRRQAWTHAAVLAASLAFLPIIPDAAWKPVGGEEPTWRILGLLAVTLGGPYLALSATAPLLQRWFTLAHPGRSPYRLYALSNAGSLIALLAYPVIFEPYLGLEAQAGLWSAGHAVFAALCLWCAWRLGRDVDSASPEARVPEAPFPDEEDVGRGRVLLWLGLSALPSALLLATTNQICQEVTVAPFLWIVPLALYLISFIICFEDETAYRRGVYFHFMAVAVALAAVCLRYSTDVPLTLQVGFLSMALFACCMCCHGELARSKPRARNLTLFYLSVALGGALGGAFVSLAAPRLFARYLEFPICLAACMFLTLAAYRHARAELEPVWRAAVRRVLDRLSGRPRTLRAARLLIGDGTTVWRVREGLFLACAGLSVAVCAAALRETAQVVLRSRNFHGVVTVARRSHRKNGAYVALRHGRILHGLQYEDEDKRDWPTSYYGKRSGVGLAMRMRAERAGEKPLRVGVIGLGAGTLCVYGREGDEYRVYEINPEVIRLAGEKGRFTYCSDTKARVEYVLGDGRISLERELERDGPQGFDLLVMDAFSSDSIPMHLVTAEAFQLYLRHLKPDGILAMQVSNRYLNLKPLIFGLADSAGLGAASIYAKRRGNPAINRSWWVLATRDREFLRSERIRKASRKPPKARVLWTDDYGSVLRLLELGEWRGGWDTAWRAAHDAMSGKSLKEILKSLNP